MILGKIAEFEHLSEQTAPMGMSFCDDVKRSETSENAYAEQVWNQLLMHFPTEPENTYQMIEFFLDQFRADETQEERNLICKEKILLLVKSLMQPSAEILADTRRRL